MLPPDKEVVLDASGGLTDASLSEAAGIGIRRIIFRDASPAPALPSPLSAVNVSDEPGNDRATWVTITSATDVERAIRASGRDQAFVVVECSDWKIIPLENLIAEFRRRGRRLYSFADSKESMETAFGVLERGVDGVVIPPSSIGAARELVARRAGGFDLVAAKLTRITDAGMGDRACVDTTSELSLGEGMLVGSRGDFFFLVHGETLESQYIPARPFRVNAGSLHAYVLSSQGKTRYLSELRSPDFVSLVDSRGNTRDVSVGRVKIERRPMVYLEASAEGASGSVILQKAETIRLVGAGGEAVSVTDLKPGDEVLVHRTPQTARHFGGAVEELITER